MAPLCDNGGSSHLAPCLQVPLNETLRQEIASGYVSYEYGTIPGMVLDAIADPNPRTCHPVLAPPYFARADDTGRQALAAAAAPMEASTPKAS